MAAPARHALLRHVALPWQPMGASLLQMVFSITVFESLVPMVLPSLLMQAVVSLASPMAAPALHALMRHAGVAVAADGRVFVADTFNHRIRVISADGATVSTYAGDGVQGFADGSTTTAQFDSPTDVVVASDGRVFVADTGNQSYSRD